MVPDKVAVDAIVEDDASIDVIGPDDREIIDILEAAEKELDNSLVVFATCLWK